MLMFHFFASTQNKIKKKQCIHHLFFWLFSVFSLLSYRLFEQGHVFLWLLPVFVLAHQNIQLHQLLLLFLDLQDSLVQHSWHFVTRDLYDHSSWFFLLWSFFLICFLVLLLIMMLFCFTLLMFFNRYSTVMLFYFLGNKNQCFVINIDKNTIQLQYHFANIIPNI